MLRYRPAEILELYAALENIGPSLGPVQFVTRARQVLLRSSRIFADLTVMTDGLGLAIHSPRETGHRLLAKVLSDGKQVTHVAKLHALHELEAMKPFLRAAYGFCTA